MPRKFPIPDPMMRFLDEEEIPFRVADAAPQLRALGIRHFLVARCSGLPDALGWDATMHHPLATLWEIVDQWSDERLERAIVDAKRRKKLGLPIEYPFSG